MSGNEQGPWGLRAERTLTFDDQQAVVTAAGAGLRSYTAGSVDIVAGYPAGELAPSGRGHWLVPWPNRVIGGAYTFDGVDYQLAMYDPDPGHAIHGHVRWVAFDVVEESETAVEFTAIVPARYGYPWTLHMRVRWDLGVEGLRSTLSVRNEDARPAPFGAGMHPYLAPGPSGTVVDEASIRVPGRTRLRGEHHVLTERAAVGGSDDFRQGQRIGTSHLGLYTDLERDASGIAHTVLERADGPEVDLWQDQAWPFVLVYTADQVSAAEGVRGSLGVEPMTCATDAFNSGDGLITLGPGETFTGSWGITVSGA